MEPQIGIRGRDKTGFKPREDIRVSMEPQIGIRGRVTGLSDRLLPFGDVSMEPQIGIRGRVRY